jgi:hypothetical protein
MTGKRFGVRRPDAAFHSRLLRYHVVIAIQG